MAQLSSILPKLHLRLMPTLLMMYVLAFLDRANVGFAKTGLAMDVGIGDAAFAFGASIFFVGYAVLEVPSNLILHKVGARRWMARIMITWGLVSAANAFVQSPMSFYGVRFLLGITEAGFFPGVIYYLTYWYPTSARARSVGLFYYGAPLALSLGGPLSGQLVAHEAFGLHGWQVMFLIEGLMASIGGIAVLFLLNDRPEQAPWLDAEEKAALRAALAEDEGVREHPSVLRTLRDSRILFLALVYFLVEMGFYGLTFYLPAQVAKLLGASIGLKVGLVTTLPWICALIAVSLVPPWCDRKGNAREIGAWATAISGVALAVSALAPSPLVALIALCVAAAGLIVAPALFWTLPTGLLGGAAAAGGIALINSIGNLGGFVAPNLRAWLDIGLHSSSAGLIGLGVGTVIGAACFAVAPQNK
jgi:MFS transporter, ACS family, inner membrane transport protein